MSNAGLANRRQAVADKSKKAKAKPTPKRRVVAGLDDRVPLMLYTVEQAAQALGMSKRKMEELIARGTEYGGIASIKIGGLRRVPVWALEAYTRPQAEPLNA